LLHPAVDCSAKLCANALILYYWSQAAESCRW